MNDMLFDVNKYIPPLPCSEMFVFFSAKCRTSTRTIDGSGVIFILDYKTSRNPSCETRKKKMTA